MSQTWIYSMIEHIVNHSAYSIIVAYDGTRQDFINFSAKHKHTVIFSIETTCPNNVGIGTEAIYNFTTPNQVYTM